MQPSPLYRSLATTAALAAMLALSSCAGGQGQVRADAPAPAITQDASAPDTSTLDQSALDGGTKPAPGSGASDITALAESMQSAPGAGEDPPAPPEGVTPSEYLDSVMAQPTQEELDYAAIFGEEVYDPIADPTLPPSAQMPVSYDPWEPFNRRMHRVNNAIDRTVALPLARAYVRAVPRPVRLGISNFFSNLGQPVSAVNALLQGKPKEAGQALGRFVMNATLGIGGIFDPASDASIPHRSEDFGQTLGVWGWENSRYLELPLFGPRTLRDAFGLAGDAPLSPTRQIDDDAVRFGLQGLQLVDIRTQLMAVDRMREGAADEYALVRDAWLQRRNYQIHGDRLQADDEYLLPDYLLDDEANPTVPADAIPVQIPDL